MRCRVFFPTLKNSPENLALTFKAYRNLDALYDVLNSVVESAGAFAARKISSY